MPDATSEYPECQLEKFKGLARKLEADEDEARWDDRLAKVLSHKPAPEAVVELDKRN